MNKRSIVNQPQPASSLKPVEPESFDVVESPPAATLFRFFSFSYSVTEVSSVAGRTHVTSRSTRLTDGKLVSEQFEGELPGNPYAQMAQHATDHFARQMRLMMQPFSWLLPPSRDRRG